MSSKFLACETARIALEESSKQVSCLNLAVDRFIKYLTLHQEIEKFRTAHLAALDKCMGYQEENDLLRASVRNYLIIFIES